MMDSQQTRAEDILDHKDQKFRVKNRIEQYASTLRAYSSQYGSNNSMSYTADNILGRPHKYPLYGDSPQTYTPKTYGMWWKKAPSGIKRIRSQCYEFKDFESTEFIELEFDETVFPQDIQIFETFHTGTVCAIWALCLDGRWRNLWKGTPTYENNNYGCSRIFSPKLKHCFLPTCVLRLELDSTHHNYFPSFDAVSLRGYPITEQFRPGNKPLSTDFEDLHHGSFPAIDAVSLREYPIKAQFGRGNKPLSADFEDFYSLNDFMKLFHKKNFNDGYIVKFDINNFNNPDKIQGIKFDKNGYLGILPTETIFKIFEYLDLKSLFRCTMLNSFYYQHATDSLLYKELNFKVYWPFVDTKVLTMFTNRCAHLQKLDLSWCTSRISESSFVNFLSNCGKTLTQLRLDSAQFVHDECVKSIPIHVPNLKELRLGNCLVSSKSSFECLKDMKQLETLSLYQTDVFNFDVIKILKTNGITLRHLDIGGCNFGAHLDEIAAAIHENCPNLESIDFWKSGKISSNGIKELAYCNRLREIDLGWCLGTMMPEDSIKQLAMGCPLLEKVFFGALRGAKDRDLDRLIDYCPKLKQIDLMGTPGISFHLIIRFLTECPNLEFIDVSCCNQIHSDLVNNLRLEFPNVFIQAIHQTPE